MYRDAPLALFASALAFPHPVTGEALRFEAAPPEFWPWTPFPDSFGRER